MGFGIYGLVFMSTLSALPASPWLFQGLGLIGLALFWVRRNPAPTEHSIPPISVLWIVGIVGFVALGDALSPPVDTDEIYQHLALPHQLLLEGTLTASPLNPDAARPLPAHLVHTALYSVGGSHAAKVFHLLLALLLLLQLHRTAERELDKSSALVAVLLLVGSYSVLREIGLAYNNLSTALLCLLALDNALQDRPGRMAIFSGMALAAKYTAAPVLVGIYLAWLWSSRACSWLSLVKWTAIAGLFVAPWWIRNAFSGVHPLFPYAGWEETTSPFMWPVKYGMGRGMSDFLSLPWNITMHGDPESFVFLGRVSPGGLLLLPVALLWGFPKHRGLAIAASVAFIGWAAGPHWVRYLLPAAPILALGLASGVSSLNRWGKTGVYLVIALGLPGNWGPWLKDLSHRGPAALDSQRAESLLEESVPGWKAVEWINTHTPKDAKVGLLFSWSKLYIDRPILLGSVEDHVPSRVLFETQKKEALATLKSQGVTHLLVRGACGECSNFLSKSYPFLSSDEFEHLFLSPERAMKEQLLEDAVKVFESAKYSVWRLL